MPGRGRARTAGPTTPARPSVLPGAATLPVLAAGTTEWRLDDTWRSFAERYPALVLGAHESVMAVPGTSRVRADTISRGIVHAVQRALSGQASSPVGTAAPRQLPHLPVSAMADVLRVARISLAAAAAPAPQGPPVTPAPSAAPPVAPAGAAAAVSPTVDGAMAAIIDPINRLALAGRLRDKLADLAARRSGAYRRLPRGDATRAEQLAEVLRKVAGGDASAFFADVSSVLARSLAPPSASPLAGRRRPAGQDDSDGVRQSELALRHAATVSRVRQLVSAGAFAKAWQAIEGEFAGSALASSSEAEVQALFPPAASAVQAAACAEVLRRADELAPRRSRPVGPLRVTKEDVLGVLERKKTSAPGVSGLSHQVLLDACLVTGAGEEVSDALLDVVNSLLEGSVPGDLLVGLVVPLAKSGGGVRPIVILESVLRVASALAAKELNAAVQTQCPEQFGVCVPGGAEAVAGLVCDSLASGKFVVKIDFKNAFGSVFRAAFQYVVARECPHVLHFVNGVYSKVVLGVWADCLVEMREGCLQGDPCSPALFSLALHAALAVVLASLPRGVRVCAFLDDLVVVGDDPVSVLEVAEGVVRAVEGIGLVPHPGKCCFLAREGVSVPDHPLFRVPVAVPSVLGVPLPQEVGGDPRGALRDLLESVSSQVETVVRFDDPQTAVFVLSRVVFARLTFLLRCLPPSVSAGPLASFDNTTGSRLRVFFEVSRLADFGPLQLLPWKWGGLGVCFPSADLAAAEFVASVASTVFHFPDVRGPLRTEAVGLVASLPESVRPLVAWLDPLVDSAVAPPPNKTKGLQRSLTGAVLDRVFGEFRAQLVAAKPHLVEQLDLLKSPFSVWAASVLPFGPFVRDGAHFRAFVLLRSRAPWPVAVPCRSCYRVPAGESGSAHAVGVCGNSFFQARHNAARDVLESAAKEAGWAVQVEAPLAQVPGDDRRLRVDLLLESPDGRRLAVDVTCSSGRSGQSVADAERVATQEKAVLYGAACTLSRASLQTVFFSAPLCVPGPESAKFLSSLLSGSRFTPRHKRSGKFWARRLVSSMLLAEERALCSLISV